MKLKTKIQNTLRPLYGPFRFLYSKPLAFYLNYKDEKLNSVQKQFLEKLSFYKSDTKGDNGVLLVQMVEGYEYAVKLAVAAKALAKKNNLQVFLYNPSWFVWIGWGKIRSKLSRYLIKSKSEKIYRAFGNSVVFEAEDKYQDQAFIKAKLQEITRDVISVEAVLFIKFEDVLVGDLIYDTYLRYFHKPTIEKIDADVIKIIEIALNLYYNFKLFIKSNNIKALLNTYSSYIHHGITARICLNSNIEVYTLGSYSYIIQKISKEFPYHQINHTLFSPDKVLSQQQLEEAKKIFTSRFEGKIDAATSYMKQSAFSDKPLNPAIKELFSQKQRNIVIYVHDFYDSPHIYRVLQFSDLYQFLKKTLEELIALENASVFIKIHPNGIEGCKEKTIELVHSFNTTHFHILDETVSNLHILELKPDLIVTAMGTVGMEMAYFEIPTVALHDNIYTNFNFVHTCHNKEEFFSIIKGQTKPVVNFTKEKIYSFYYQAYLEKIADKKTHILNLLHSSQYPANTDNYLQFVLANSKELFNNDFVELYGNALNG
jgi:hypothetical protein